MSKHSQQKLWHDVQGPRAYSAQQTDARLRRAYGISLDQYEAMVEEQHGKCAICHRNNWQALAVDHSHSTGLVRRLLCHACNMALGHLNGKIEIVQAMLEYLRKYGEG